MLNVIKKEILEVDYNEVDKIINKYFFDGQSIYECVPDEEWSNYSSHEITVDGLVDEDEAKDIANRSREYMTSTYLNDLCRRGIIEKGIYLIKVSW